MSLLTTPEEVRAAHLNHEASLKSIGVLYYLAAVLTPIVAISSLLDPAKVETTTWVVAALLMLLGVAYVQLGRWFRALNPKVKIPGTALAAIGLLAFPLGTVINAYIIYLIHSKKGAVVFSDDYKAVISATPSMKYKTSIVVWILLGLVVAIIVTALLFTLFSR